MDDGVLTIKGQKKTENKSEEEKEGVKYHKVERSSGSFMRKFRMPDDIDQENCTANFENGVLQLTFPKLDKPVTKGRNIEIK